MNPNETENRFAIARKSSTVDEHAITCPFLDGFLGQPKLSDVQGVFLTLVAAAVAEVKVASSCCPEQLPHEALWALMRIPGMWKLRKPWQPMTSQPGT